MLRHLAQTVDCPTCGRPVEWTTEQRWRPFCSERCRIIDLGAWVDGSHRIPSADETGDGSSDSRLPPGEPPAASRSG
ncbi:MAG: DNA gyrase inhibitor YacG [Gammaproteobacteria bacterium]|nr:DNA gyrase inhibitor YacG [Gammaproteobacteria bacterium]MDJ0870538.1 DNA gyrase inhibitor YacG [Gammaproteobacteria bacterium]MDJ0891311.1 DNA gyrase inhibitor YacG [Gammaproteobacteria bacterium]